MPVTLNTTVKELLYCVSGNKQITQWVNGSDEILEFLKTTGFFKGFSHSQVEIKDDQLFIYAREKVEGGDMRAIFMGTGDFIIHEDVDEWRILPYFLFLQGVAAYIGANEGLIRKEDLKL